jgi:hypothetical protein
MHMHMYMHAVWVVVFKTLSSDGHKLNLWQNWLILFKLMSYV